MRVDYVRERAVCWMRRPADPPRRAPACCRNGAQVTLYESEDTLGGHTLTDDSSGYPVDLGFQVYNLTTYPHLVRCAALRCAQCR